jgi:chemotaxis protein histidine kinase CheA/ActR/RegA family two-component response regulator
VGTKETAAQAGVTEIELAPSSGLQDGGDSTADLTAVGTFLDDLDFSDGLAGAEAQPEVTPMASGDPSPVEVVNISVIPPVPSATKPQASPRPKVANTEPTAQIPVALSRLDHASQSVVETLLATRAAQNDYQTLQSQLLQLVVLTQEGIQHMTQLRQIQDDYAVLDSLNSRWSDGPTPERYRQGYTSINRLLENSLRLSELGAEAEKVAAQITQNLKGLDRSVLRLQNTLEGARLVPFRNLSLRVRATLRDLITRFGKPAQLEIEGEQVELDAGTASKLEPALLHLIRNAYDHGLESVDERLSQGKPKQGAIALSLQRRGSNFWLELRDDGRGIDAHHVQQLAEAKGLAHTRTATPTDLLEVLCQPGFSSKATVSDISGRGVGMDVVAAQINQLGGRMSLETTPQQGTTFRIQFPVPQLLVSCVVVQAGSQVFAVPADDIATAAVLSTLAPFQPPSASDSCSWRLADGIPGLDLAEYWQPNLRGRSLSEMGVGLQIRLDNQVFWLLADELVNQTQLLINRIPQPLLAPRGLLGVSLQTNGQLIPVLDGVAIADTLLHAPETTLASDLVLVGDPNLPFVQPESTVPLALIVDDAALMRRRIEASLTAAGYRTHTCADGQEAWNWLQAHPQPEVLITDIEMPVMDGFTLIDRCRQAGMTLPVLVISSRLAEEWSREARRLGATDFLTKGFSTPELLNRVKTCLNAPPSDPQGSTVPAPDNTNDSLEQRL